MAPLKIADRRGKKMAPFNLPPLGEVKETVVAVNTLVQSLQSLNTEKLKQVITLTNNVRQIQSQSKPGEIGMIMPVFLDIVRMSDEKVANIAKITGDVLGTVLALERLAKMFPQLKLDELVGELKKEVDR
jgi:hypothetical protein